MSIRLTALKISIMLAVLSAQPVASADPTENAGPGESDGPSNGERQFLDRVAQLAYPVAEDGWLQTVNNGLQVCDAVGQPGQFSTDERWQMGRNIVLLMYAHIGPIGVAEEDRADGFASAAVGWLCPRGVVSIMLG